MTWMRDMTWMDDAIVREEADMSDQTSPKSRARREFFKTAGLGAGAAAVAGALGGAAVPAPAEAAAQPDGYRETAHVKRFYELAKSF